LAVEARYNLALCLLKTGRLAEAESALRAFAGRRFGSYRRQQARHLLAGLRPQQDAQ
jgi:TolA-binding protein